MPFDTSLSRGVVLLGFCLMLFMSAPAAAQIPYVETFETGGLNFRYGASNVFYDGSNDHFQRTDGISPGQVVTNVSGPYSGYGGRYFWAGEDLDDGGGDTLPSKTLTLQTIDVSSTKQARFTGKFAAGCSEGPNFSCYDSGDSLVVRYSVDGGKTYQTGLQFSYVSRITNTGSVDLFNEPLALDINQDGSGDGPVLSPQMQTFGFDLPPSLKGVTIQIQAYFNGAAEEFAFDDLTITSAPPNPISVVRPLEDRIIPDGTTQIVDLRGVFETSGSDFTLAAASSSPGVVTADVSNDLKQLSLSAITEGRALIDVVALDEEGNQRTTSLRVTVVPGPPEMEMEVRIAEADDFCSDVTNVATCSVIGTYRFSTQRSDTVSVDPQKPVLVRYVLRNTDSDAFTALGIDDERRGTILGTSTPVPGFDSLVVNRIYDAQTQAGLVASEVTGTAQNATGTQVQERDIYGIEIPEPEIILNTRLASARSFCSDVTDPSTCGVVGESRFGSPRSDTLANATPGDKVLIRYILTNRGSTRLTRVDATDSQFGPIWENKEVDLAPFDSVVVNTIVDAPSSLDLSETSSVVTGAARDGGGNDATEQTTHAIDIPDPEVVFRVRVALARDFCTNLTDPSSCAVVGASVRDDSGIPSPRPDTLDVLPGDKVLVRYVAINVGSSDLASATITDPNRGFQITGPSERLEPFDSLTVNRIYDAPATSGLRVSPAAATGEDPGGNAAPEVSEVYGWDVQGSDLRMIARIAEARSFCSDVTDASTCSVIGASRFGRTRPDTLANVSPGDKVLIRYIARNFSSETLTNVSVTDSRFGDIVVNSPDPVAPFDSIVVNRIYDAPSSVGVGVSEIVGTAEDLDGFETESTTLIGIEVPAPTIRAITRIAPARDFCSNVTDPSTCGVIGDSRFGQPRPDTLQIDPGERVLVRYVLQNVGRTDLTNSSISDSQFGSVVSSDATILQPFDSLVVNKIYDAPSTLGATRNASQVSFTAEDTGGNPTSDRAGFGIRIPTPVVSMEVRVGRADIYCSDVTDRRTCGVIGDSDPRDRSIVLSDTLAAMPTGEAYLVRYIATNRGLSNLFSVTIEDEAGGIVADEPNEDLAPFDSLVVNRIYTAGGAPGVITRYAEARATDTGGNSAVPRRAIYGVQGVGADFRLDTQTGPASLFCVDPNDVTTCSLQRLKTMQANPALMRKTLAKIGSERDAVLYTLVNTGSFSLMRHTLVDNVAGPVYNDDAFTITPLDSLMQFAIYDEVPVLGQQRMTSWTALASDGTLLKDEATGAPLPVELVAFTASVVDRDVTLLWSTASEEINAGFEVQQYNPADESWDTLGFREGAGTTSETQRYQYVVPNLSPDVYRFRLRQIDLDGRATLSAEVEAVVSIDAPFRFTTPSPHPVRDASTLSLTVREAQPVRVEMYDLLGRRVRTLLDETLDASRERDVIVDATGLSSGVYFVRAIGESFVATHRVTIVR